MKTLDRQKLEVTNRTRSNPVLRDWCGQFTPEFAVRDLREAVSSIFSAQSL
jgi:hypothetical protein